MSDPVVPLFERLLDAARQADDWEQHWGAVHNLVKSSPEAAFAWSKAALRADEPGERALAADVLGDLADYDESAGGEVRALLADVLDGETSEDVHWAVAHALAGMPSEDVVEPLVRLAGHPADDVRWQAVVGLSAAAEALEREDPRVTAALLAAAADPDDDVRDFAMFALGTATDVDNDEVRAALRSRLADPVDDVWGEALVGLARRGDTSIVDRLAAELASGDVRTLLVEAALHLGDPRLHRMLKALRDAGWAEDPELLEQALDACRPARPA